MLLAAARPGATVVARFSFRSPAVGRRQWPCARAVDAAAAAAALAVGGGGGSASRRRAAQPPQARSAGDAVTDTSFAAVLPHGPLVSDPAVLESVDARRLSGTHAQPPRWLFVGEGDFSFSAACARLRPDVAVVATSLEPEAEVRAKWGAATSLDTALANVTVLHEARPLRVAPPIRTPSLQTDARGRRRAQVDGTALGRNAALVGVAPFDRILFMFPHCGVKGQIHRNRALLAAFFRSVARDGVLAAGGVVEVALGAGQGGTPADAPRRAMAYGDTWQVLEQAAEGGFLMTRAARFAAAAWSACGYSSRGCWRSLGRGTMEGSFRTEGAVVHAFVRESDLPADAPGCPTPLVFEFDITLWVDAALWGAAGAGDAGVARLTEEVLRAARAAAGADCVRGAAPIDVWRRDEGSPLSVCLRLSYCAPRRALTRAAAVAMHDGVRAAVGATLPGVSVRTRSADGGDGGSTG